MIFFLLNEEHRNFHTSFDNIPQLILINVPALINSPRLFSRKMFYLTTSLHIFHQFYEGEQHVFVFPTLEDAALQMESTVQGKNLLL